MTKTRLDLGPATAAVVAGSIPLAHLHGRVEWWWTAAAATALAASVIVRNRGKTGYDRLRSGAGYLFGKSKRARLRRDAARLSDVAAASGSCGVGEQDSTLFAMIQLAPNLDLPTVVADSATYTEDTVALADIVELLDQFGLRLDIDIVVTGRRVCEIGNYGLLYDQLIAGQPVVGDRRAWLVLRMDVERNVAALAGRGPAAEAAPKALAGAAVRIAGRLRENGIAAHALPAAQMVDAVAVLCEGAPPGELRESWGRMRTTTPSVAVTSFWADLTQIGEQGLDECWVYHGGRTTVTVSLSAEHRERRPYSDLRLLGRARGAAESAHLRVVVRYTGPAVRRPPAPWLRPLGGQQSDALTASLPGVRTARTLGAGAELTSDSAPAALRIPIGPNGQIVGTLSDQPRHSLAVPLFDPALYKPRKRMVDAHVELSVAQQLVLRAAVVGAHVEIHTLRPDRWQQLVSAVGDRSSVRLAGGAAEQAADAGTVEPEPAQQPVTVAVFDCLAPSATAASTTLAISDPGTPTRSAAHLTIEQVADNTVSVALPMGRVRVDLVEPLGEGRYLDAGQARVLTPESGGGTP